MTLEDGHLPVTIEWQHSRVSRIYRVLFLSRGKILLEGNPKTLHADHGKANLEELFITVAREPLSLDL